MMKAYSELYLDDAMSVLGEFCASGINVCAEEPDQLFMRFAYSVTGREFGRGNPKYTAGISGPELYREVILETSGAEPDNQPDRMLSLDRTPAYWAGWVLAWYQWNKNKTFIWLYEHGLQLAKVIRMYQLHEADLSAFEDTADQIVRSNHQAEFPPLKSLLMSHAMTQKHLSEASGVSLRMIQLYEQGQNDLKKAQAQVVLALADTMHCSVADLLE